MKDYDSFKKMMVENEDEIEKIVESREFQEIHDTILNQAKSSIIDANAPITMMRANLISKMIDMYMNVDSHEFRINSEIEKLQMYINMVYKLTEISEKIEMEKIREEGA